MATYVYGAGIDEVLTMTRAGQTYYYFYDGLGSVTDITNATGEVVESYQYDVYGQPNHLSSIGNPYYFTGRQFDSESGLYYYRNRHYSPTIGRFLQRDPLGHLPDVNVYRYVGNDPINCRDPYGLLNPHGQWPLYSGKDFENGRKRLSEELMNRYPSLTNEQADKIAFDVMKEMTISEAQRLQDLYNKNKQKEIEDLIKDIYERTGGEYEPPKDEGGTSKSK